LPSSAMTTTTLPEVFHHQQRAADFISSRGSGAIFHEIGCGKTRTAIEIYFRFKKDNPKLRLLVVCPISLIDAAWGEDVKRFSSFTYCNLRKDVLPADIYIGNFEMLLSAGLKKLVPLISAGDWMCVVDESSRMKNAKAQTTKALLKLRKCFNHRIIMSGTPAPNSELEYWAQMTFVADGIFLPSFYAFRNDYFHLERGGQRLFTTGQIVTREQYAQIFSKGWKYAITEKNRNRLLDRIKPWAHYARKVDCLDLPDQIDEIRKVKLSSEQRKAYQQMKTELITEIKGQAIVAPVALAKLMKLREITSGFAMTQEGVAVELGTSSKLTELMAVLEESNQQAIIWCSFKWEIAKICGLLGSQAVTLYSDTKDREASIKAFKSGTAKYLVAHGRSAGHGLTFVNCSLQIFFSIDYSYEIYEQSRGRTHRVGQKNPCVYIHLIADTTIDENILSVVQKKQDAQEIVQEFLHD